jgi:localization factor PodJL
VRPDIAPDALRRVDEAFRALVQRLENNERGQMEAQRAMSAAANEINTATRDQARAFEHLNTRIDRVERHTDTAALRDAVRGLHQGLSRLAEAIAKTTNESSEKITVLSSAVELLASKMISAQDNSNRLNLAVEEKLAALDTRVTEGEDRLELAEECIVSTVQLAETVGELEKRMGSIEQRVEETLGHYLTGIERGLEQVGERLQRAEKHGTTDGGLAEAVRSLTARLDAMEKRDRPVPAAAESAPPVPVPSQEPQSAEATEAVIGKEDSGPEPPCDASASGPETSEPPCLKDDAAHAADAVPQTALNFRTDDLTAAAQPAFAAAENYLTQARRAARPVAETSADRRLGNFRMRNRTGLGIREHRAASRAVAAGLLAVLILGGGVLLARGMPGHANVLAPNTSHLLALDGIVSNAGANESSARAPALLPAPRPPAQQPVPPAVAAANGVAAASVFAFGDAATGPLAQLMVKANGGDAKAAMVLGLKYADGDGVAANDIEAVFWLQKAAEGGEAVAQYRLGTLYERGRGVAPDSRQAMRWYIEAANQGNRRAMHNLAVMYADGAGTQKNFPEAARWFKDAADLGLTDSQFNLAVLYERGLGVKSSLPEAYKWYAIAAASGDAESRTRLAALANQLASADREAAERAAKAYKPRPIDTATNNG